MGGASLLENWIQEGDEQGNVPVKAFVFLSIVFGLIFFGAKLLMNDRVNMVLSIQKFFGYLNKMFRSAHRPPSREGGSVGRAKKKKEKRMNTWLHIKSHD